MSDRKAPSWEQVQKAGPAPEGEPMCLAEGDEEGRGHPWLCTRPHHPWGGGGDESLHVAHAGDRPMAAWFEDGEVYPQ